MKDGDDEDKQTCLLHLHVCEQQSTVMVDRYMAGAMTDRSKLWGAIFLFALQMFNEVQKQ